MAKIEWDATGERYFEAGVDHGVFYPWKAETSKYEGGVAWNGLTGVTESPEGAEATDFWADNIKYGSITAAETFGGTIEAYTYPKEFEACDGTATLVEGVTLGQQARAPFGFCYRTTKQSDATSGTYDNYKLHLWYGCKATPSEKAYETINDSPDAITFSWEINTNPVTVEGFQPTSLVVLDSKVIGSDKMKKIEDKLYGGGSEEKAVLLFPNEIKEIINAVDV